VHVASRPQRIVWVVGELLEEVGLGAADNDREAALAALHLHCEAVGAVVDAAAALRLGGDEEGDAVPAVTLGPRAKVDTAKGAGRVLPAQPGPIRPAVLDQAAEQPSVRLVETGEGDGHAWIHRGGRCAA
jgi:hypothetical protein